MYIIYNNMSNNIQCNLCHDLIRSSDEVGSIFDYENGNREIICIGCINEIDNNVDDDNDNNDIVNNPNNLNYGNCIECNRIMPFGTVDGFDIVCHCCVSDFGVQEYNIKCCGCSERAMTNNNYEDCPLCFNCNYYHDGNFLQYYKPIEIKRELKCIINECPVCLDETQCKIFYTCNHLMCEACNHKLRIDKCPMCRNDKKIAHISEFFEHPISELIEAFNQDNNNNYPFSEYAIENNLYFNQWYFIAKKRYNKLIKKQKLFNANIYDNHEKILKYRKNLIWHRRVKEARNV